MVNSVLAAVKAAVEKKDELVAAHKAQPVDPAVELAQDEARYRAWLEKTIRELARQRQVDIVLRSARIDDDYAKLLAQELRAATASLAAEGLDPNQPSSEEHEPSSERGAYDLDKLLDDSDPESGDEEDGSVHLRNVRWPGEARDFEAASETSDSDSERSYRFTPRDERVYEEEERTHGQARRLTAVYVPRSQLLDTQGPPEASGCAFLDLGKNPIGGKGMAYLCGWLKGSALQSIRLADSPIGDTGVALLGRAIPHASYLRTVALQRCGAREYGIRHLAHGLGRSASMRQVWLMGNAAGSDGARHLATALQSDVQCLAQLGLEGCQACAAPQQPRPVSSVGSRCARG